MGFFLFVWAILAVPMSLYFLVSTLAGFFSAKFQAVVSALAGLVIAWMCVRFGTGEGFAPLAIFPTVSLYALTTLAAVLASDGLERAYASDLLTAAIVDSETQA